MIFLILCAFLTFGTCHSSRYTKFEGDFVEVSNRNNELWAVNRLGAVFRFTRGDKINFDQTIGYWKEVPNTMVAGAMNGKPAKLGASPDGWTWMATDAGSIYRFNDDKYAWEVIHPGGWLGQISGQSKDSAIGIGGGSALYQYTGPGPWFVNVHPEMNGRSKWIAICDNNEKWLIDTKGFIYRYNPTAKVFDRMPGMDAATIDCQNNNRVAFTSDQGLVYHWVNNGWKQINRHGKRATVGPDSLFFVNQIEKLYYRDLSAAGIEGDETSSDEVKQ